MYPEPIPVLSESEGLNTPAIRNSKNFNLVGQTKYESLLDKISEENQRLEAEKTQREEEEFGSQLNIARRRNVAKEIVTAYFFLRHVLGMTARQMFKEEFSDAHAALKELAKKDAKTFWRRFLCRLGFDGPWEYYLANGYFNYDATPFGVCGWQESLPWGGVSWGSFDDPVKLHVDMSRYSSLPPNFKELVKEIFEERHGKKKMPETPPATRYPGRY